MTDRYRGYPVGGRSATFNPARVSLASNLSNYNTNPGPGPGPSSAYIVADADFVSSPSRYTTAIPRGFHPAAASSASPTSAPPARTYNLNSEPRPPSRPVNREPSRTRRSTVDNTSRPPIIVTTLQDHHPHAHNPASHSSAASHSANPSTHNASPVREPYRASDGKLFTQPASSIRSRSTNRPYHASSSSEDYNRPRDRELVPVGREVDSYRSSRPSVLYPSDPRHSNAAIDYGDEGYQYTNAGELVKYDLDHAAAPGAPRSRRHERHESFDRGYHRPNINYSTDQRSFNVNTSHDLNRHYSVSSSSRSYDTRGGPPPSTRGFDKINRAYDNVPPVAPAPPSPGPAGQLDGSTGTLVRREVRRPRPVSLTQETASRITAPENYYRGHVPDDTYEPPRFYDDSVTARGFGIRLNPQDDPEERSGRYWESKRDESCDDLDRETQKRREKPGPDGSKDSDDEAGHVSETEREEWYRAAYKDESRDRQEARRPSESELERRPSFSFRDKITSGLGMAASAVGFGSATKREEKKTTPEEKEKEPARRPSLDESPDQQKEADVHRRPTPENEREPERNGDMGRKSEADLKERQRREAEAKLNGEAVVSGSDSDGGRRTPLIRRRSSSVSKSNDTGDLNHLKEQTNTTNTDEKEVEEKKVERDGSHSPERAHSASPTQDDKDAASETPNDESRGRDLVVHSEVKQVRVVSPPREKKEGKPLKGILKQPKASFPEDRNHIREGVAPHKDDKKLKEVPPGAKWTKINRKIVNPEALEIGGERYEVRDDFVIVLRVLNKEDIQKYASATQVLRERRRNKENGDRDRDRERDREGAREGVRERERERDRDRDYDRSYEEYEEPVEEDRGRRNGHHQPRHRVDEGALRDDWNEDRERERRRRSRKEEEEYSSRTRDSEHRHHRSSHRERT